MFAKEFGRVVFLVARQVECDEVRAMDDLAVTDAVKKKFFQTNAERWFKL